MIKYDPHDWVNHLFEVRGSVIGEIAGRVLLCGAWALFVVVVHHFSGGISKWMEIPEVGHSLTGVALGLLLVLRTNASYDRYWEGRRLWGSMVNASRNLARTASVYLAAAPELGRSLLAWTSAFAWASMNHLRGKKEIGAASLDISSEETRAVLTEGRLPVAISRRMTGVIAAGRERGLISDIQQATLDQNVQILIDVIGGCERIHNTPMPFAYVVHLRRALILYVATLPFALVGKFGWATVPTVMLIAYILVGIDEIAVEIEDPFGDQKNDLPLEDICGTIEGDMRDIARAFPDSPSS